MLQCCICLSSVTLCIVAKWRVLEQKLVLTAYRKSYEKSNGTKMNDLDLLFGGRTKVMSTVASRSPLNISVTVKSRCLVPKDHQ